MFISKLNNIVESYDPYGESRLNGAKAAYVLLILYTFNWFFTIPNPYFHYFFTPIAAIITELFGRTLKEKYTLFISCMLLAAISTFVFDNVSHYWYFFIIVFFYSLLIYFPVINKRLYVIAVVPVALALGSYSLLFINQHNSFYFFLNNFITTIAATIIIVGALALFPRSYYYRLWLRALLLLIKQMNEHLSLIEKNQRVIFDPVQGHTNRLTQYSQMLPPALPIFSILKISLLINELHLMISVAGRNSIIMDNGSIKVLIHELSILKTAIENEKPCDLKKTSMAILDKIINSWNYLCLNI